MESFKEKEFRARRGRKSPSKARSWEREIIASMPAGTVFFTPKPDKSIATFGFLEGRKCLTVRGIFVSGSYENVKTESITKVTITA